MLSRPTTTRILLLTRYPWTPPFPREATTSHLHQVNPMKFEKNYWPMHANQNHVLPCGGYPGAIFLTGMLKEQYNIDAWSKLHAALRLDWGSSWICMQSGLRSETTQNGPWACHFLAWHHQIISRLSFTWLSSRFMLAKKCAFPFAWQLTFSCPLKIFYVEEYQT